MKRATLTICIIFFFLASVFGQNRKDSLIVFVGEIVEVKYSPEEKKEEPVDTIMDGADTIYSRHVSVSMDSRYVAKYKILKIIYGTYITDTIEFIAYDHHGQPGFSNFKTVLLFVSIYSGKFYHEKYQYFDVYKTVDNRWASPGDPYKFDDYHRKKLKPHKIHFHDTVFYDISNYDKDYIKETFPEKYFNIIGQKAFPIMGTYIEELFIVKKEGVLKARGIF